MASDKTADFLRRMNARNDRIAAMEAEEKAKKQPVGVDPIREQRMRERREKFGTLRAIQHPGRRPQRVRRVWGFMDPRD